MSEGRNRKWIAGKVLAWTIGLAAGVPCALGVSQARTQPEAAARPAPAAALVKAPAASASTAAKPGGGGTHEGIKVHGHWIIEVRDPDGKLVSHNEFENKLISPAFVSSLLTGADSIGTWEVDLGASTGSAPCGVVCAIVQSTSLFNSICTTPPAASNYECGLTVTVPTSGASAGDIVLTGSAIATHAGSINVVSSDVIICSNTVSPALCDHGAGGTKGLPYGFTGTTGFPGSPISVALGQTMTVSVTISFQ